MAKLYNHRLSRAIDLFRLLDPEMQAQTIMTLLAIYKRGSGCALDDICEDINISRSAVTRNVQAMCETNRHGEPGYNLVYTKENPDDRRYKFIYLTPLGEKLEAALDEVLNS